MITTVAASLAVAIGAVPTSDNNQGRLCNSDTASNPVCCSANVLGAAAIDCATREFSVRLSINGLDHLHYLQPRAPHLKIPPTSRIFVPALASKLGAVFLS